MCVYVCVRARADSVLAYKEHTDCVLGGTDLRDRVASVLVYLNDVKDGGETRFPGTFFLNYNC